MLAYTTIPYAQEKNSQSKVIHTTLNGYRRYLNFNDVHYVIS